MTTNFSTNIAPPPRGIGVSFRKIRTESELDADFAALESRLREKIEEVRARWPDYMEHLRWRIGRDFTGEMNSRYKATEMTFTPMPEGSGAPKTTFEVLGIPCMVDYLMPSCGIELTMVLPA